ncbi:MAG: YbaN family protein [Euryarchaeota archaeon]|nr:YbaN family protein [Euryarchaeota archaeon]
MGGYILSERLENIDAVVEKYSRNSTPLRRKIYVFIGCIFIVCAIIGIWIPGWPTVSWAVPAAYLFSISNEKLFRWTLTNRWFGSALFDYYSTGKTLPKHVKTWIIVFITIMSAVSIWITDLTGDPGYGQVTIVIVWLIGVWFINSKVKTRS